MSSNPDDNIIKMKLQELKRRAGTIEAGQQRVTRLFDWAFAGFQQDPIRNNDAAATTPLTEATLSAYKEEVRRLFEIAPQHHVIGPIGEVGSYLGLAIVGMRSYLSYDESSVTVRRRTREEILERVKEDILAARLNMDVERFVLTLVDTAHRKSDGPDAEKARKAIKKNFADVAGIYDQQINDLTRICNELPQLVGGRK